MDQKKGAKSAASAVSVATGRQRGDTLQSAGTMENIYFVDSITYNHWLNEQPSEHFMRPKHTHNVARPTDASMGLANMLMVDPPALTFAFAYIVETLTFREVHEALLLLNRSISSKCLSTIGGAQRDWGDKFYHALGIKQRSWTWSRLWRTLQRSTLHECHLTGEYNNKLTVLTDWLYSHRVLTLSTLHPLNMQLCYGMQQIIYLSAVCWKI